MKGQKEKMLRLPCEPEEIEEIKRAAGFGIYVHIPFCRTKCPYCDFNSKASSEEAFLPEERYATALIKEFSRAVRHAHYAGSPEAGSLYFGGGTPSLLSPAVIGSVVEAIRGEGFLSGSAEITVEVNPVTVDADYLRILYGYGVNRISIGAQSFSGKVLKSLGRAHTADDALRVYGDARSAGFTNIGLDLIFAVPGQSVEEWELSVETVLRLRPEHISIYGLTYEEGTPFGESLSMGEIERVAEDSELSMFKKGVALLSSGGYRHYEISNLSLPGLWSRHNMNYWQGGRYMGLGAGAHSFIPSGGAGYGIRQSNEPDAGKYMKRVEDGGGAVSFSEELSREEAMTEALMLGLRCATGVDVGAFRERFGTGPDEALTRKSLISEGLLFYTKDGRLLLTEKGINLYNEIY